MPVGRSRASGRFDPTPLPPLAAPSETACTAAYSGGRPERESRFADRPPIALAGGGLEAPRSGTTTAGPATSPSATSKRAKKRVARGLFTAASQMVVWYARVLG